jgi:hypothetical protein
MAKHDAAVSFIFILLAACALYINAFTNGFVLDDHTLIIHNPKILQGNLNPLSIFTSEYWAGTGNASGLYRPFAFSTFIAESALVGIHAWSGHAINIFLYALTVWLFARVLQKIFEKRAKAKAIVIITTLIFFVHPIHTEIVSYIKSRDDLLALLGGLLALYFLLHRPTSRGRGRGGPGILNLAAVALAYAMALFSKESALIFGLLIPAILYFKNPARSKRFWVGLFASLGAVTVAYMVLRVRALHGFSPGARDSVTFPLSLIHNNLDRWTTTLWIGAKYLWLNFIPWPLIADYSYNQIPTIAFFSWLGLLLNVAFLALTFLALWLFLKRSSLGLALVVMLAGLAIPLGYSYFYGFSMAERLVSVSSVGGALVLGLLIARLPKRWSWALASAVVIVFAVLTVRRDGQWRSTLSLLQADELHASNNSKITFLLGRELRRQPDPTGALLNQSIELLKRSLDIYKNAPEVLMELGSAYGQKGDLKNARLTLEESLALQQNDETLYFLGLVDLTENKMDQANFHLDEALKINPNNPRARQALAQIKTK